MAVAMDNQYNAALNEQQKGVREMVLAGLGQIRDGRTKDLELGIRRFYFKEYKIFYKIEDEIHTVFIVRILHMRMNSRAWLYRTFGISE